MLADTPEFVFTVITAVPSLHAVTFPSRLTLATLESVVDQVYVSSSTPSLCTVYMPETDSLVSYVDGTSMAEYDLRTKKVVTEVTASHPIFSLMRYGDYVVAIGIC